MCDIIKSEEVVVIIATHFKEYELCAQSLGLSEACKYIYSQFQKDVKLPREYVEYYYKDNAYTNHFYSEDERMKYMRKWEEHIE